MNRQQRRQWAKGIHAASAEAAGVMDLLIVQPTDVLDMLAAAMVDDDAARLSSLVTRAIMAVIKAPADAKAQCLSCCRDVTGADAFAVVLAIPHRDRPSTAVASVMCPKCGSSPDQIRDKAITAFRDIWPDARAIPPIHHHGGRA